MRHGSPLGRAKLLGYLFLSRPDRPFRMLGIPCSRRPTARDCFTLCKKPRGVHQQENMTGWATSSSCLTSRIKDYRISKTVATRLPVEISLIALLRLRVREPVQTHPRDPVFWPGWATSEVEQESKQDRIGFALPGQPTTVGWRGMT